MIKFISVFLLFWSNDYNILSCQPFHDERFPTLSENYGYLCYCTFKVLSKWFKKNFVFTCKTIDNSKVWGQLAIFICCFFLLKIWENVWRRNMFDENMSSFQRHTGRVDIVQICLLERDQQNISQTNLFEF